LALPVATVQNYLHGYGRRGKKGEWARELITFVLGDERYAVDLLRVREIVTRRVITEVPRTPPFLLGIFSLRGQIVPVIDLRRRMGLGEAPPTRHSRLLIVNAQNGEPMGLFVDGVRDVIRVSEEELETRPPALAGKGGEFVDGIARPAGGGMVILLGLDHVLGFGVARRREGVR
jgi:purine-binding chemotaxis protein CheW